jgi:hypothetical protein
MAIMARKTKGGGARVDPDIYTAKIVKVEEKAGVQGYGNFLIWHFLVANPVFDGDDVDEKTVLTGTTSFSVTENSKLYSLLMATGFDLDEGEEVDLESLVGKICRVEVVDNPQGDVTFSKVDKFFAAKKKKKKAVEEAPKKKKVVKKKVEKVEEPEDDDDDEDDFDFDLDD